MQTSNIPDGDVALTCLQTLAAAAEDLHRSVKQLTGSLVTAEWAEGLSYQEILPLRRRLEMIERISTALRDLTSSGHLFRRVEVRALYAEGLTMAQLASVFGVSRQRVSAMLQESGHPGAEAGR